MSELNLVDRFFKLIDQLNKDGVEYIVIGGFAVILFGLPRTTEDIDLFLKDDEENIKKFRDALRSLYDDNDINEITRQELIKYPVIRFGTPDNFYIDIITRIGTEFNYDNIDFTIKVVEGHKIRLATAESLYRMKRNTLREIDNLDLRFLKEIMTKRNAD